MLIELWAKVQRAEDELKSVGTDLAVKQPTLVILTKAAAPARREHVTANNTALKKQAQCVAAEKRKKLAIFHHDVTIRAHWEDRETFIKAMRKVLKYRK